MLLSARTARRAVAGAVGTGAIAGAMFVRCHAFGVGATGTCAS